MLKDHLKHMAIAGGVVLAVLVAFSVDLETALRYAVLLACPVGMIFMMWHMTRHGAGEAQHHDSSIHSEVHEVPASRDERCDSRERVHTDTVDWGGPARRTTFAVAP